jgi:hypothetical protein
MLKRQQYERNEKQQKLDEKQQKLDDIRYKIQLLDAQNALKERQRKQQK